MHQTYKKYRFLLIKEQHNGLELSGSELVEGFAPARLGCPSIDSPLERDEKRRTLYNP